MAHRGEKVRVIRHLGPLRRDGWPLSISSVCARLQLILNVEKTWIPSNFDSLHIDEESRRTDTLRVGGA